MEYLRGVWIEVFLIFAIGLKNFKKNCDRQFYFYFQKVIVSRNVCLTELFLTDSSGAGQNLKQQI
jgi:hypothetical protein